MTITFQLLFSLCDSHLSLTVFSLCHWLLTIWLWCLLVWILGGASNLQFIGPPYLYAHFHFRYSNILDIIYLSKLFDTFSLSFWDCHNVHVSQVHISHTSLKLSSVLLNPFLFVPLDNFQWLVLVFTDTFSTLFCFWNSLVHFSVQLLYSSVPWLLFLSWLKFSIQAFFSWPQEASLWLLFWILDQYISSFH